ncbi:MAG: glycosyltransferase family 4 protein [Bacteroidota bacterium]
MSNRKNIWIINEYAGSPYNGMEFRHYYLSKELIKLGYNVTIISASYSHLFKNLPVANEKFNFENIDGINYVWIKVPQYSSSHSKKRVLKWFIYALSLFFLPIKKLTKPDFIIVSPMQTMPILPALKWAKKLKSKVIFEVKDIWPLSIQELGSYSSSHPFIKLLKYFEKMSIEKSDAIVSVLPNYGEYLKEEGYNKPFYYIPNGVLLEEMQNAEPLDEKIEQQIPKDKFIVGYAGTIGIANALEYFIQAAELLKNNKDIVFVIVGEGSEKLKLIQQSSQLSNVIFLPAIPKKQIQSLLQKFDACYIGLQSKELFKYGVSPNKLFDYMYAAKPIIFSINSPNSPVEQSNSGIVTSPNNQQEIANAILKIYSLSKEERTQMGNNGKNFVCENHTFDKLTQKYHSLLQSL